VRVILLYTKLAADTTCCCIERLQLVPKEVPF